MTNISMNNGSTSVPLRSNSGGSGSMIGRIKKRFSSALLDKIVDIDIWAHNRCAKWDIDQIKIHQVTGKASEEDSALSKGFVQYVKDDIFSSDMSLKEKRDAYRSLKKDHAKKEMNIWCKS